MTRPGGRVERSRRRDADASGYAVMLRHPVAGRIALAHVVSMLGDYLGMGALLLLLYERTGTVLGPAAVFAAQAVPALLLGTVGAPWIAGLDRRRWLPGLAVSGAALVTTVALVPNVVTALLASAGLGALATIEVSLRSAVTASDVPPTLRGRLIAIIGVGTQGGQVVGYLASAVVAQRIGAEVALIADAATFVVAGLLVVGLPLRSQVRASVRPGPIGGIRLVLGHPVLRLLAPVAWATMVMAATPESLAAGLTTRTGLVVGLLMAAHPFGMAVSTAVLGRYAWLERVPNQLRLAGLSVVMLAGMGIALGAGAPVWLVIALTAGKGGCDAWFAGTQTVFAQVCRPEELAQVTATMIAASVALEGAGALFLGALATLASPATAYVVAAGLIAVASARAVVGFRTLAGGHLSEDGAAIPVEAIPVEAMA